MPIKLGLLALAFAAVVSPAYSQDQQHPLVDDNEAGGQADHHVQGHSRLHGRFLQITDIHPDSHYKVKSKTDSNHICHGGSGDAGHFGAPGTDCDSPWTLVDATMDWIRDNLRDSVDFVIWTGDSARHDNDENIPRTKKELVESNRLLAEKMLDVFADETDEGTNMTIAGHGKSQKQLRVPIIPTIGNNDIMPHNIFKAGPNGWTKTFRKLWHRFIPEEQRHSFEQGGWFFVEVIPDQLAVFSLNTMYFYESNSAVDGCEFKADPGYEHMEWLRVQLQLLRERKMKAILTGHVPPARTDAKQNWYESCWQKYALWLRQYRDVIVGSIYGHMNIDHFMLQDFRDIEIGDKEFDFDRADEEETSPDDKITIRGKVDYLSSLKDDWAKVPIPPGKHSQHLAGYESDASVSRKKKSKKKKKKKKFLKKVGGPWAERYALAFVPPSVIPLYFPTLRVVEYNISGLEDAQTWYQRDIEQNDIVTPVEDLEAGPDFDVETLGDVTSSKKGKKKQNKNKKKKKKKTKFKTPKPPPSEATPGPAYSNQPLTWLGYKQYFANVTDFNAEVGNTASSKEIDPSTLGGYRRRSQDSVLEGDRRPFEFEIEYDTMSDSIYKLKDMTVNSYLDLARRISGTVSQTVEPDPSGSQERSTSPDDNYESGLNSSSLVYPRANMRTDSKNIVWRTFLQRAFVGSTNVDDLA